MTEHNKMGLWQTIFAYCLVLLLAGAVMFLGLEAINALMGG